MQILFLNQVKAVFLPFHSPMNIPFRNSFTSLKNNKSFANAKDLNFIWSGRLDCLRPTGLR
jgi:hypothetical protein